VDVCLSHVHTQFRVAHSSFVPERNCSLSRLVSVQGCKPSLSNMPLRVGCHVCNIVLRLLCYLQKAYKHSSSQSAAVN
jgi:hypothetical protein